MADEKYKTGGIDFSDIFDSEKPITVGSTTTVKPSNGTSSSSVVGGNSQRSNEAGKAADAIKAAYSYAGADGYMSKREQKRWRKANNISKKKARLVRRGINAYHNAQNAQTNNNSKLAASMAGVSRNYFNRAIDAIVTPASRIDYINNRSYNQQRAQQLKVDRQAQAQWAGKQYYNSAVQSAFDNLGGISSLGTLRTHLGVSDRSGDFSNWDLVNLKNKLDSLTSVADKQALLNKALEVLRSQSQYSNDFIGKNADQILSGLAITDAQRNAYLQQALLEGHFNPFSDEYNTAYANYKKTKPTANYYAGMKWNNYKSGGKMNTRYYQEGGAAPQESNQDMEAQVIQLVQAAMSGDEKAAKTIEQIVAAAKQGDEQAVQLAQMIQAVAEQLEQGQAQAAKMGAKLSYLHSLKTGCPSGYEVAYRKQGGHICKECVKKNQEGDQLTAEDKAMGRGTAEQVEAVARKNKRKYPQYTMDQCRGAAPIKKNGKNYYLNGDGQLIAEDVLRKAAKQNKLVSISKHQFGGHPELRHVVPTVSGTGNDEMNRLKSIARANLMANQDIYNAVKAAEERKAMLAARELNRIQAAKATPAVTVPTTPVAVVEQVPMEVEGTIQGLPVVVHKKGGCLKRKLCKGKKVSKEVSKNANGGYVQMHQSTSSSSNNATKGSGSQGKIQKPGNTGYYTTRRRSPQYSVETYDYKDAPTILETENLGPYTFVRNTYASPEDYKYGTPLQADTIIAAPEDGYVYGHKVPGDYSIHFGEAFQNDYTNTSDMALPDDPETWRSEYQKAMAEYPLYVGHYDPIYGFNTIGPATVTVPRKHYMRDLKLAQAKAH